MLPDGRVIGLFPDTLTRLSLSGGIPGILERTVGFLDLFGRAAVKVDVNPLGNAIKGLRVWACALVIDASAPSGVAAIAGPTILTIR